MLEFNSPNTLPFYAPDIDREYIAKMHVRDWLSLVFDNGAMPNDRPYDTIMAFAEGHPGFHDDASLDDQCSLWRAALEIFATRAVRAGEAWGL